MEPGALQGVDSVRVTDFMVPGHATNDRTNPQARPRSSMSNRLTIGRLAKLASVGVETVRFYERKGLLARPEKTTGTGYREYPPEAVSRLKFIRTAKELGFTLKEITELLQLRVDSQKTCSSVRQTARLKIQEISERIQTLEDMREALQRLERRCRGKGPTSECPFLEALDARSRS